MPTKIEWAEETWNPITGCTKVSEGCQHCYAERMAKRLAGRFGYPADDPFRVTLHPDRLERPLRWRKSRRVFVCSMGDLFHETIGIIAILDVWSVMARCSQHIFMVLTKRPQKMRDFIQKRPMGDMLPNVWLGITAENQCRADERIPVLMQIPAVARFVSVEPMLGPVDLSHWPSWVICGAETGPGARPMDLDWARSLRDQCQSASVPFFFKRDGDGSRLLDGREWNEYPAATD